MGQGAAHPSRMRPPPRVEVVGGGEGSYHRCVRWSAPDPDVCRCPQCGQQYRVEIDTGAPDSLEVRCTIPTCRVRFNVPSRAVLGRRSIVPYVKPPVE